MIRAFFNYQIPSRDGSGYPII
jgi:hypothetical protein